MRAVKGQERGTNVNEARERGTNPVAETDPSRNSGGGNDVTGKKGSREPSQRNVLISLLD